MTLKEAFEKAKKDFHGTDMFPCLWKSHDKLIYVLREPKNYKFVKGFRRRYIDTEIFDERISLSKEELESDNWVYHKLYPYSDSE